MLVNVFLYIAPLCFTLQGQQSHKMVIFAAILILMTLFILYSSNNNSSIDAVYASFHVATNHAAKTTDLRKWTGKDGYVPIYGNKVGCAQTLKVKAGTISELWTRNQYRVSFPIGNASEINLVLETATLIWMYNLVFYSKYLWRYGDKMECIKCCWSNLLICILEEAVTGCH